MNFTQAVECAQTEAQETILVFHKQSPMTTGQYPKDERDELGQDKFESKLEKYLELNTVRNAL